MLSRTRTSLSKAGVCSIEFSRRYHETEALTCSSTSVVRSGVCVGGSCAAATKNAARRRSAQRFCISKNILQFAFHSRSGAQDSVGVLQAVGWATRGRPSALVALIAASLPCSLMAIAVACSAPGISLKSTFLFRQQSRVTLASARGENRCAAVRFPRARRMSSGVASRQVDGGSMP